MNFQRKILKIIVMIILQIPMPKYMKVNQFMFRLKAYNIYKEYI